MRKNIKKSTKFVLNNREQRLYTRKSNRYINYEREEMYYDEMSEEN